MKIAIMQPYIFPYIGYFQLINAVDKFVVYDNIQFTKKGWINRNRILVNGKDEYFSLPLKKDSDYLDIVERKLATSFNLDRIKLLRKIEGTYKKAPEFNNVYPLVQAVFNQDIENLFDFIYQSLIKTNEFLDIKTEIVVSSTIPINHQLKAQDKVIAICKEMNSDTYINPIGGLDLYSIDDFKHTNIQLNFIKSSSIVYEQFNNEFIPWLSVIDVMMFNGQEKIKKYLQSDYILI